MTGSGFFTKLAVLTANQFSAFTDESGYVVIGKFDTVSTPDVVANVYQKGCLMIQTDAAPAVGAQWQNTGTLAVPVWTLMPLV